MGCKVMPSPRYRKNASNITISSKDVIDAVGQAMSMRGSTTSKGEEGEGEFQLERDQSQLLTPRLFPMTPKGIRPG